MSDVTVDRGDDHVSTVCLHRPPENYFDSALLCGLADCLEGLAGGTWCRAVVLTSEGKHFCAGLDFAGSREQDIGVLYGHALRIFAAPLPVIAAVQGSAVGGGLGLAMSADFRIAAPSSRFSANFARLGFHHGFGLTVTLPRAVGEQRAAELLMTGRRVGGAEAHALGLCDELVNEDDLLASAHALAGRIAGSGPLAVRSIRSTLRRGLVDQVRAALEIERAEQERLRHTSDFAEGIRAYSERREPRFRGE